ncbi:MAG: transglutaminase family protein [Candidatus Dormibacteraeota bacterium]|nr:transglutaminase family protein [Candidatus Dormibacteraeota bacterium]
MSDPISLRIGCEFRFDVTEPSPALIQVAPREGETIRVLSEAWEIDPPALIDQFQDMYGNSVRRTVLGRGSLRFRYDARAEVPDAADPVGEAAPQQSVEALPGEVTHFLLASRYCDSDTLMQTAWDLFGATEPGWPRAQAISDRVHEHLQFQYGSSDPQTTAADVYREKRGVCRDFAHLFIAFCRAVNLPARYVFGYLPDIGVPPPSEPMDFCAWAEVYLGDRWWTFDPRNNQRRVGRVAIGRGRDAVDVAMITAWGPATFREMTVWAEPV